MGNSGLAHNLLLNSSFSIATNLVTPDDWDLHHAAALEFKDLYNQYNIDDSEPGPITGARVLKITNSERGFFYLYLLSRLPDKKLPVGDYIFSVYVKSDRVGNLLSLSPSLDHMDLQTTQRITTDWRRYSAKYRIDDSGKLQLSPMLVLPDFGTYWISAPQLESGDVATPYAPSRLDLKVDERNPARVAAAAATIAATAVALAVDRPLPPSARFEFSGYTDEPVARMEIRAGSTGGFTGVVDCSLQSEGLNSLPFKTSVTLAKGEQRVLEIPIAGAVPGEYSCELTGGGRSVAAKLSRLAPSAQVVRVDQWRNTIDLDKVGYQIRGVMVGGVVPAEWYFEDIVDHGINTILYYPRTRADGSFETREFDQMLNLAEKYGLKVVVGPMVMGRENDGWKRTLDYYADLVRAYCKSAAIIGWFIADEPGPSKPDELQKIYSRFKALDPYKLVFVNWGSDDVPAGIGDQPPGSLRSTDLYSIDYYPFANTTTSMETYTLRTIRVLRSGALAARPSHSWLQLYGSLDVSREPTGDELSYMAYVNLLFGGNYSYFTIRSTAKPTWDRVRDIDGEISTLMGLLWFDRSAIQLKTPTLVGNYLYSAWRTPAGYFLIVLHDSDRTESLAMELESIFGPRISDAHVYFQGSRSKVLQGRLYDSFGPYSTRVYQIN